LIPAPRKSLHRREGTGDWTLQAGSRGRAMSRKVDKRRSMMVASGAPSLLTSSSASAATSESGDDKLRAPSLFLSAGDDDFAAIGEEEESGDDSASSSSSSSSSSSATDESGDDDGARYYQKNPPQAPTGSAVSEARPSHRRRQTRVDIIQNIRTKRASMLQQQQGSDGKGGVALQSGGRATKGVFKKAATVVLTANRLSKPRSFSLFSAKGGITLQQSIEDDKALVDKLANENTELYA
jgi:hypothetical protein